MEEEGIFYFFKHTAGGHQMVLANTPQSHPAVPYLTTATWEGGAHATAEEDRVFGWSKGQEIRSGKFTVWDDTFEMPDKHLDAEKSIMDTVSVGTVTHKLKVANNDSLELYDYPGGYASRFDGVNKSGGEQASNLQHIFEDNKRVAEIRMQEEALSQPADPGQGRACRFHRRTYLRPHPAFLRQRQVRDHQCAARCQAGPRCGPGGWRIPVRQWFHLYPFGATLPAIARDAFAERARGADGGGGGPLRRGDLCR